MKDSGPLTSYLLFIYGASQYQYCLVSLFRLKGGPLVVSEDVLTLQGSPIIVILQSLNTRRRRAVLSGEAGSSQSGHLVS